MKPSVATPAVLQIDILINGTNSGLSKLLQEATIHYELNKIPFAKFTFITAGPATNKNGDLPTDALKFNTGDVSPEGAPPRGAPPKIDVIITVNKEKKTLFKGIVKSLHTQLEGNQVVTKIECKDVGYLLTLPTKNERKPDDAFDDILADFTGKSSLQTSLSGEWGKEKMTFNNAVSPWDFIIGYLDSVGLLVTLRGGELSATDILKEEREIAFTAENGLNIFSFSGKVDPQLKKSAVNLENWDIESQSMLKVTAGDGNDEHQQSVRLNETSFTESTRQQIAKAILERSSLSVIQGKVVTIGNLEAKAGDFISLNKVNDEIDGQPLLISQEIHTIKSGCWKTEYAYGLESAKSFSESTALATTSDPQAQIGQTNNISGLQIGVVTQLEGDPNNQFRIRVRIPTVTQNGEGVWARLANLNASKDMGSFFIPNVGDEVIIGCLGNNPDTPIVLGSLYSSAKPAAFPITKENYIAGFVTKEGSKLVFDDKKKSIEISTKRGNKLLISENAKGISVEDENENKIVMDANGITIESAKDFVLKAKGNVTIEGVQVAVKSKAIMELKGSLIKLN